MTAPDFGSYSLAMFCGEERVFMSREPGLKPLAEWLDIFRGRHRNCLLHDRVVGLAAARLITYSGLVTAVTARVASWPARRFLGGEGISLHAEQMVDSILTEDRTAVCPEEVVALETPDRDEYLRRIYRLIRYNPLEYELCRGQCGYTPWCRECMKSRGLL
ncbi:MAG TPA: DUF1893 domain-containing protein [Syntrophales bacterium]|nr:DUF1893 domain-containing protein [Syntrophales bacterium]HRT26570.1 DUF1893 domain-containing protein [Syntrophales bacterium]